jgi:hypothetical protein
MSSNANATQKWVGDKYTPLTDFNKLRKDLPNIYQVQGDYLTNNTFKTFKKKMEDSYVQRDEATGKYQLIGDYVTQPDLKAANFATKGDLSAYQPSGNYAMKNDLADYQPKGNYQPKGDYQPAGNYAMKSDLSAYQPVGNYQPVGDYALKADLSAFQPKGNYQPAGDYQPKGNYQLAGNYQPVGDYALKADLSAFQPKGNYQPAGDYQPKGNYQLAGNYQPAGDYALKSDIPQAANFAAKGDLAAFQLKGDYVVKGDLAAFQPKGDYALKSDITAGIEYNKQVDFVLGKDIAPERGQVGPARALVRDDNSALTINYAGDFTGGVNIQGPRVNVAKTLRVENGISMGGEGEFSVDFPDVSGGRFVVDKQGNIKSRGDANIGGNVNVPSGKAINIRDQFHGMQFSDDVDGPSVYGYAGGKLRVAGNARGETPVDALKWDRTGVKITGNAFVGDNVVMSGNNSWILHTPDDGRKQLYVAPGTDGANWDWSKQTQFMPDGNVNVSGNITAAGRNILGEIDELKNKPAAAGSTDFDAFTNGNDAKFSPGWEVVSADSHWDPSIRGPGRTGRAYTVNKDNLGDDENDNNTSNRTADIAVPAGMKSGFLFHLPWSNCRHFDIFGVLANGKEVFIRRVNAFQNVRNGESDTFHDGIAVVPITRVDRFANIRIKGVRGRINYMGTGWTKNNLDSYASGADSGFVSAQNIVGPIDNFVVNENLKSKTLRVDNGISMGGEGEFSVDFPNVPGGRFVVDNQGNIKSRGDANIGGNVNVAGGLNVNENLKSKTLRVDNGISMGGEGEFSVDFPNVPGGRFVVDNQGNIKSRGDANIGGNVNVAGGLNVDGNFTVGGKPLSAGGSGGIEYNKQADFVLGRDIAPERGAVGPARALVRDGNSALTINYAGDFTGGVNVGGPSMNVAGKLTVQGDTNLGGVNFINNWDGDATNTTSQIANDTKDFKALMITGNKSNDKTGQTYKDYSDFGKGRFGDNRRNVQVWDDLSLPENSAQLCIGPRWCIRAEGDALVFRDMKTAGDNRYAMFPEKGNTKDL